METKTLKYKDYIIDIDDFGKETNMNICHEKYVGKEEELDETSWFIGTIDGFKGMKSAIKFGKVYIDKYGTV